MVKRCIGIELGCTYLRAVQLRGTDHRFCLENAFGTRTRRATDAVPNILSSLMNQHGFDPRARLAVSLPPGTVLFRNVETDSAGLEQIRAQDLAAFEDDLPYPPDQVAAQVASCRRLPDGRYAVLLALARKESIDEVIDFFSQAKLQPALVDAPVFAAYNAVAVSHPEITVGRVLFAWISDGAVLLAAIEDNQTLLVRNIPIVSAGADMDLLPQQIAHLIDTEGRITWQKTFGDEINRETRIYLAADDGRHAELKSILDEKMPCRVVYTTGREKIDTSTETPESAAPAATGLALRLLATGQTAGVNFLETLHTGSNHRANLRKDLVCCSILLAAIAAMWLVGLFVRLGRLEARYSQLKQKTHQLFRATLPQEHNIVNPLAQIDQKLNSLRAEYDRLAGCYDGAADALQVLYAISNSRPPNGDITADDLLISGGSIRLKGTCDSFQTLHRWRTLLQRIPAFTSVEVLDEMKKDQASGKVTYTMLISSNTPR